MSRYAKGTSLLSWEEIEWAYQKWCMGYTQYEIADALHCSYRTVQRVLQHRNRIRPVLKYERE